jgi:hypothetical protein
MWVSNDFPISLDANGNYFGLVDIPPGFLYAPATGQVKMQGFAQRTGIPTDGTAELPDCTFWVPSDLNGTKGRLMVRGDPIRFTTGYFKVGVWQ